MDFGHPCRILIVEGSGSGKAKVLLSLINHGPDIDKIYLHAKDPYEAKYQLPINKRESRGLKYLNDWKAFIKYSNDMDDIYKNIEEYNPNKNLFRGRELDESDTARKRFDDFNNGIELFKKAKSDEMKLEDAKKCRMCLTKV